MRIAIAALSAVWATAAIAALDDRADPFVSYAAAWPAAEVATVIAGSALLVAGVVAATQQQTQRIGMLAMVLSILGFAPVLEAASEAAPLVRSVGGLLGAVPLVVVAVLAVAWRAGSAPARWERAAVAGAIVIAGTAVAIALVRDPLLDLYCTRNCSDNVFLLHGDPEVARALWHVLLAGTVLLGVGLVPYAGRRLWAATPAGRRALASVLVPAALAGLAEAAYGVALLITPLEDPQRTGFAAIYFARAAAYTALAVGVAWSAVRVLRTRTRVARVAGALSVAPSPGGVGAALAEALGDPDLEVLYVREDELVDAEGRPRPAPGPGRGAARITRRRRALAMVLHDPAVVDERMLERALGPAALMAVENEMLRAEALAQIRQLRESRIRIVEAGDAERRRLERNLHDGAQQRLLAVAFDLRRARADALRNGDAARGEMLEAACRETEAALDELRELAHGIYPAILTEAGLAPALQSLADESPLAVEIAHAPAGRLSPVAERTAYVVLAEAIEDAGERAAGFLAADVVAADGRLVLTVEDDGTARRAALERLADRVGALGGSLDLEERRLTAEIPCA